MRIDAKIVSRFAELLEMSLSAINGTLQRSGSHLDGAFAAGWKVRALNLVSQICGADHQFYKSLDESFEHCSAVAFNDFRRAHMILEALKEDYVQGNIFDVSKRITADVFEDFLEQAEYLLTEGYHQPAAVVAGAVLEDGLRKLCDRNNVTFTKSAPSLNDFNMELPKAGVYDKSTFKQLDWVASIRNYAAHGEWDKFTREEVEKMIPMVRDFMVKYF